MKTVLICPSPRAATPLLSQAAPLALVPLLGQGLIEYWLSWLSRSACGEVLILAHDRPEMVECVVDVGARWGLNAKVLVESRELTPAEARLKYGSDNAETRIELLDHFPGASQPLFSSYPDCFARMREWMPFAITLDRVGVKRVQPGVWVGSHSQVSPGARLHAPCWVGNHVFVGAGAVLGPGTIIEDGAFLEPGVEIVESVIGPDTFVGSLARVSDSFAWGQHLVNWKLGSTTLVPDSFLLCALRPPRRYRTRGWLARLAQQYAKNKEEAFLAWKHLLLHKGG